eukprot:gene7935-9761_t
MSTIDPLLVSPNPLVRRECLLLLGVINKNLNKESEDIQLLMINFLKDPDYRVREASLKALSMIFQRGGSLSVNKLYQHIILSLLDGYEQVRLECIKLIWIFGNIYPNHVVGSLLSSTTNASGTTPSTSTTTTSTNPTSSNQIQTSNITSGTLPGKIRLVDDVFKKICNTVNDPSVIVRNCACKLLGCIYDVSLHYLIQTLSKEVIKWGGKKHYQIGHSRISRQLQQQQQQQQQQHQQQQQQQQITTTPEGDLDVIGSSESQNLLESGVIGAFIQGLEDEFYEVRSSAIDSMCELSVRNNEFAQKNIEFLVDIFNDEIESVRINSIHSLRKIGNSVTIKEEQLHVILANLESSSYEERHSLHRLLSVIHLSNFSCLHATIQALLVNLQKYNRDIHSIFECLSKIGSKNQFTEFIVEDLLRVDPKFATVEPNMDDIFYVAVMIVVLNSSVNNSTILSLLPQFCFQHHLYFKDKYPQYFPQHLTNQSKIEESKYEMKLESQESIKKFLNDTLSLIYGGDRIDIPTMNTNGNHKNLGFYKLLQNQKFSQIDKLFEESERNLSRISNISKNLQPTSSFYQMNLRILKIIVRAKQDPLIDLSNQISELLLKITYQMEYRYIGLDTQIRSILLETRIFAYVIQFIVHYLESQNPKNGLNMDKVKSIKNEIQKCQKYFKDRNITTTDYMNEIVPKIDQILNNGNQQTSSETINQEDFERPKKLQKVQSFNPLYLDSFSFLINNYEPSVLYINNLIKKKKVNIQLPIPFDKPIEYVDSFPLKLIINATIENIKELDSLYLKVSYYGKTLYYPIPNTSFTPSKPLSYTMSHPLYLNIPKVSLRGVKEVICLKIKIVESVESGNLTHLSNTNHQTFISLCKPVQFNLLPLESN